MFKIFPKKSITFKSRLSKDEVISKLSENIEEPKIFGTLFYKKQFFGKIDGDSFEIIKNLNHNSIPFFKINNSSQPSIKGKVSSRINGSEIKVDITCSKYMKIPMLIFLTVPSISWIYSIFKDGFDLFSFLLILFLFMWSKLSRFFINYGFNYNLKENIKTLRNFFKSSVEEDEKNPLYDHE